jgi:GTP-sensing pleiotropic transcriptional regulator CodY
MSLLDHFNNTINTWIAAMEQYNFHSLCKKPTNESWSIGQVYMHLLNETNYYIEEMKLCISSNENASEEMIDRAKMMFSKNEFPDEIIKGDPSVSEKIQQPASKLQLEEDMLTLKKEMNSLWTKIINSEAKGKTTHPGLGYFSSVEWFQFADMHLRHHFRQKERLDHILGHA